MTRDPHDILISIETTHQAILAEQQRTNAALDRLITAFGSTSRSSVELAESAKGTVQVCVKTYVDSPPIDEACIEAVAGFRTLKQEVERGLMDGWRETVANLANGGT